MCKPNFSLIRLVVLEEKNEFRFWTKSKMAAEPCDLSHFLLRNIKTLALSLTLQSFISLCIFVFSGMLVQNRDNQLLLPTFEREYLENRES